MTFSTAYDLQEKIFQKSYERYLRNQIIYFCIILFLDDQNYWLKTISKSCL